MKHIRWLNYLYSNNIIFQSISVNLSYFVFSYIDSNATFKLNKQQNSDTLTFI